MATCKRSIAITIACIMCATFVATNALGLSGKLEPEDIEPTINAPIRDGVNLSLPEELGKTQGANSGYLDATLKIFGADPTGRRDSTAALNRALEYARKNQLVVYLPSGNYKVTDTVECAQGYYRRSNGVVHQARLHPCVLMGERTGVRPKIILQRKSRGFNDPNHPKPVIHFWTRAGLYKPGSSRKQHAGAVSMNQMLVNVDIEIEEENQGAIAVALYGAQGTGIEEVRIDVSHGLIGIQGGSGSGGSVVDVEIVGGRYGLDYREGQPVPVVVGARLKGQSGAAVIYRGRQTLTLVGCEIQSDISGPAVVGPERKMQPHWGQISIVDSMIMFSNPNGAVIDSESSFTMNNVFLKGSSRITSTGLTAGDFGKNAEWVHVKQYAYGANPNPRDGYNYTMPIYVDYEKQDSPLAIVTEYDKDPLAITRRHAFQQTLPDYRSKQVVNVKESPYYAKGDGVTDDTAAIQRAVSSGKNVFLPKGYYNITKTVVVPPGVKLFGVARHLSVITTTGFSPDERGAPLLRVAEQGGESVMLAFFGLMPPKELPHLYALDWQGSAASVVRNVNIFSRYLEGFSSVLIPKTGDREIPLVRISGGGQWFNYFQEDHRKQAGSYRHVKVDGSNEGLVFYGLDLEHSRGECNGEIVHSRQVTVFGLKGEGNYAILCVTDSDDIAIFGFGGNASAFPGSALLKFDGVNRYLLTNLVTHHRPVGKGSEKKFSGIAYDPLEWVVLQEEDGSRVVWKPTPLERPVLVSSGMDS